MALSEITSSKEFKLNDVIFLTSHILERIIKFNEKNQQSNSVRFRIFDSEFLLKNLSIKEYLARISLFASLEPDMLIIALMYLDKFLKKNKDFFLSQLNCYK